MCFIDNPIHDWGVQGKVDKTKTGSLFNRYLSPIGEKRLAKICNYNPRYSDRQIDPLSILKFAALFTEFRRSQRLTYPAGREVGEDLNYPSCSIIHSTSGAATNRHFLSGPAMTFR